jgi:hypothetical protein
LKKGESTLRIADLTGRIISSKGLSTVDGNQLEFLDITDQMETGCYLVTLITPYETISQRLIVQ